MCVSHFTDVKDTDTDVTDLIDTLHMLSQRYKVVSLYHKLIYVIYFILLVLLQT